FFFLHVRFYEGLYLCFLGILSIIIPLLLNFHQRFFVSKLMSISLGGITFMSGIVLLGYDSGFIYGLTAMQCLPILYFKKAMYRAISFGILILEASVLFFIFHDKLPLVDRPEIIPILHVLMFIGCSLLIITYFVSSAAINEFYEKKTIKLLGQLTKRNEELKNFSYSTSHDLKQPLRTIQNFISVLKKKKRDQLDDEGQHFLDLIDNSGKRLHDLIEALLSHSVLGQNVTFEQFDCNELIQDVLLDLHTMIDENNATVNVNMLPKVVANKQEIGAVFQNLITNAIKFRREGIKPFIQIFAIDAGSFWKFTIKDNGVGIEEGVQDRIFQIFQKGHMNAKIQGTGIGLANCKKIVENHSGKIWLDSKVNHGSEFSFTILKAPEMVTYN
ncbi:MAG: ATP-binding protein, partial [Bacteroidota bacterium]